MSFFHCHTGSVHLKYLLSPPLEIIYFHVYLYCIIVLFHKARTKAGQTGWSRQLVGSVVNWREIDGEFSGSFGFRALVVPPQTNTKTTVTVTLRDRQREKRGGNMEWWD